MSNFLKAALTGLEHLARDCSSALDTQKTIADQQRQTLEAIGHLRGDSLRNGSTAERLGAFHETLFGRPIDAHPDYAGLTDLPDARDALIRMMNTNHFRWNIREDVPVWPVDKWVCTEFQGLRMWINLRDAWLGWVPLINVWEEEAMAFALSHLKEGSTFLDVGVNVGTFTLRAARHVGPSGKVFGFEPRPDTGAMVARSIHENGFDDRVTLFRQAVGDVNDKLFIHLDERTNPGASHVRTSYVNDYDVSVDIVRLDDVDFQGRRVEFMKMDIEGYEAKAIAGGRNFLRYHQPVCLTEFCPGMLRATGDSSPDAYIAMWNDLGYTVRLFDELGGGVGRELTPESVKDESSYPVLASIVAYPAGASTAQG